MTMSCLKLSSIVSVLFFTGIMSSAAEAGAAENTVFAQFARHIVRQVHEDKQAFGQASTCLSWFYKGSKTPPPAAAHGIAWRPTAMHEPAKDCPKWYPGGMNAARDDFAKTQTLLSVSLTAYEFALVADSNDDHIYNAAELQDLFASLSLDPADQSRSLSEALTSRFDQWYRVRNLDELMKGMSLLYERGYRVTAGDRADLDRVMK